MPDKTEDPRDLQITVDIKGDARNFDNFEQLNVWLAQEWKSFQKYGHAAGKVFLGAKKQWQNVELFCNQLRNRKNPVGDSIDSLRNHVKALFGTIPVSNSPEGEFLSALANESVAQAGCAFALLRKHDMPDVDNPDHFMGAFSAAMFGRPNDRTKKSVIASVKSLQAEFGRWYEESAKKEITTIIESGRIALLNVDAAIASSDKATKAGEAAIQERIKHYEQKNEEILKKYRSELEALVKTYDENMALQWPATYWQTKADHHERRAKFFARTFAIAMFLSLGVIVVLSLALIAPVESMLVPWFQSWFEWFGIPTTQPVTTVPTSPFVKATAFGAMLAIVYWILRLLARNMISNQHLAADAQERRVMILTYLSLLRRGKAMPNEELKLILTGIFRPASDGMVRDDASPSPVFDLLFRRGT